MGENQSKPEPYHTPTLSRKACDLGKHIGREFRCMKKDCQATLCVHCAPSPDINNQVFCKLCLLLLSNLSLQGSLDEEEPSQGHQRTKLKRLDPQTKTKSDPNTANLTGYVAVQVDEAKFMLQHASEPDQEKFEIVMRKNEKTVIFDGIPHHMKAQLAKFSYTEQEKFPTTVLNVILKQTYRRRCSLLSNVEVSKLIFETAGIIHDNPLKYYRPKHKPSDQGGYSKVFSCKRIADG